MNSAALERFRYSFFEDPLSARDGLDIAAAEALSGEDRIKAEDMLLDFLPDLRGVIGLGVLRSQRALPILRNMFAQISGDDYSGRAIEIAKALTSTWRDC